MADASDPSPPTDEGAKADALVAILEIAMALPLEDRRRVVASAAVFCDVDRSLLRERDVTDAAMRVPPGLGARIPKSRRRRGSPR